MNQQIIHFDESGNTGADLLNIDQPVFVLASVCFNQADADHLLSIVSSTQASEAKFSRIRKSEAGKVKLSNLLESPLISDQCVKLTIIHKKYMVVSKIVDTIFEPLMQESGIDVYQQGLNISLSNLLFYTAPVCCDGNLFDRFLSSFVRLMRNKNDNTINEFYSELSLLYESCKLADFRAFLAPVINSRDRINDLLNENNSLTIDPAIPSFFVHCYKWGEQLLRDFVAVHDDSKSIAAYKDKLEIFMDKSINRFEAGYDRRKVTLPLYTTEIRFEDSKTSKQLQVADIIASSVAYWAGSRFHTNADSTLVSLIEKADLQRCFVNGVWPEPAVLPEDIETDSSDGTNPLDEIGRRFFKRT